MGARPISKLEISHQVDIFENLYMATSVVYYYPESAHVPVQGYLAVKKTLDHVRPCLNRGLAHRKAQFRG